MMKWTSVKIHIERYLLVNLKKNVNENENELNDLQVEASYEQGKHQRTYV